MLIQKLQNVFKISVKATRVTIRLYITAKSVKLYTIFLQLDSIYGKIFEGCVSKPLRMLHIYGGVQIDKLHFAKYKPKQ